MNRLVFFLTLFATSHLTFGQDDPVALANVYLEQADQIYKQQKEAIEIAKELYVQAADLDPTNIRANWMAGQLYLETINKDNALPYLMRVLEQKPGYRFDILYQIGRAYHYALDFDNALEYYERYKKKVLGDRSYRGRDRVMPQEVSRRILECNNGKDIINNPSQYSIEPIGDEINSQWPDYAPVLNKKGDLMIFTSRRQEGNTSPDVDKDNFYFEDVFFSRKVNGKWTPAENIGPPINTQYHDANIYLNAEGNRLYLYKDTGAGDIYYSDLVNGKWTEPEFLTTKINSSVYSENSVSETSTDDMIFYTSSRPGGEGGIDIYYCIKDDGEWYKSKSLGPVINTSGNEDSPFLAYDGKTLYFSSTGHKGYGGYDIFKSVYDSTYGEWSTPENLGYPVNTPDDEFSFQISQDQRTGYYASVREGGLGFTDIFMVKYHGNSLDQTELIAAVMNRSEGGKEVVTPDSNPVANNDPETPVYDEHEIKLMDHTHPIFFNNDQSAIKEQHQAELDSIVQLIHKYNFLNIDISGYASADGNPRYNLELSNKRALIVLNYLVDQGVDENRIVAKGYGSVKDQTGDPEEHRRADVRIVSRVRKKGGS
ncbi:OmpA family protein [Fulvivirga lutea]|uniref:OmpA family protein n=1 Tax=Fulvivirga lutea TaxID=2810512 RepID=A0A974WE89_9BACT|nr:OmpA family protein [Fulvivirga lutea]QSE96673.1 OmpA family protein [Fulvivirga lutea]